MSPRGGRRSGTPGRSYANRTDLNTALPVTTAPGQPYGSRVAQERAQEALPMAPAPRPAMAPGNPRGGDLQRPGPLPGELGDFLRPTERPNEPLTAGLATGPGPGPEVLAGAFGADSGADELRAIYLRFPTESLRELLEDLDPEG